MRFTNKAAEVSLKVPTGLNPHAIGKVVTVQMFESRSGDIRPDTLRKAVGTLESYMLTKDYVSFKLVGAEPLKLMNADNHVEFIVYEGT